MNFVEVVNFTNGVNDAVNSRGPSSKVKFMHSRPSLPRPRSLRPPPDAAAGPHRAAGGRKDLLSARNRVSVLRPGAVQPKPDDEYEVDYCFGDDATAEDIRERSLEKLLAKVCEGFNGAIMVFGAKGSGKTAILQGKEGAQAEPAITITWPRG